ncbi:MAG TPA: glycosyltransferase family 39 protein [Thermoanaerobaculia bacterium]|nr:glycosyltransferase family 39 protein [Thermoanaerobaculia bacterium]
MARAASVRRIERIVAAAALALFAALAAFGARYHWVEEPGTAERDGYVAQAEELLAGRLPRDPYRPLLYPLATAALAAAGVAPFAAARLLANLAAAALPLLAFGFGRRLLGAKAFAPGSNQWPGVPSVARPARWTPGPPGAGLWAFALTAVNPNLWRIGQHVTTDMPFAALAAAALLAGLAYLERPAARTAAAAGLAWGLAAFTRGNALFLLPPLAAAWLLAPRGERRFAHLAAGAAAALPPLLAHWGLRAAAFGDPFHDENWKNLAWKLYGYPDWSYLERVPFSGLLDVVRHDPAAVLRGGLAEIARFATGGLPQLFGTWVHVALVVFGAAVALRLRPRAAGWLLGSAALFLAATAFSFFTWGRLLLMLLPIGNALAFAPWKPPSRGKPLSYLIPVAAALVALLAVKTFAFRLPDFVANHPYVEVATLRRLDAALPPGVALAGTSPFLGRYLRRPYWALPDAFGPEVTRPALYLEKLREPLAARAAGYLVVGERDLRDRPRALLGPAPPAPWLAPAGRGGAPGRAVVVWRFRPPQGTFRR